MGEHIENNASERDERTAKKRFASRAQKLGSKRRGVVGRNLWRRGVAAMILTACASGVSAFDFKVSLPTLVDAFKTEASSDGEAEGKASEKTARVDAANDYASTFAIDLSPSFAKFLPYYVALGKVVCESNFPLEETAGLQAEIVRLQEDLIGYFGVPESTEKISLCLFRDRTSYIAFICEYFPGAPTDRPALYVKEPGKPGVLMVRRDEKMILNVRHEMVHAYLNAALRNVPIWIDEGLAKYFETPPGERGFRNPFLEKVGSDATSFFASPPSLTRLEKLTRVDQMRIREYRESWAWTHFLIHYSPETQRVLALYLRSLRPEEQAGISSEEAIRLQKGAPLKRLLERYVPDYKAKYVEHFRGWAERREAYESGRPAEESGAR